MEVEIKKEFPDGGPLTSSALAIVVATLNSRIRHHGLSAKEVLLQRDGETLSQLNLMDIELSEQQLQKRINNHLPSALSKAPKGIPSAKGTFKTGNLVFVKGDGSKHNGRDRYIVASCSEGFIIIRKLVGSQNRAKEYKVKPSDLYHVPYSITNQYRTDCHDNTDPYATDSSDSEEDGDQYHRVSDSKLIKAVLIVIQRHQKCQGIMCKTKK